MPKRLFNKFAWKSELEPGTVVFYRNQSWRITEKQRGWLTLKRGWWVVCETVKARTTEVF